MQSIVHRLSESQTNVLEQGEALWSRTRTAAGGFLGATRDAGLEFVSQTRGASSDLATEGRSAGLEFVEAMRSERRLWWGFVGEFGSSWVEPLQKPVSQIDELVVSPIRIAVESWRGRNESVSDEDLVEQEEVEEAEVLLAIAGYDLLTAREVIESLEGLDHDALVQIRTYEETNKARVTIARAINARLGN
jgi:hypothetical protein